MNHGSSIVLESTYGNRVSETTLARPKGVSKMEYCSHPTCYESEDDATMYAEPTEHNDKGYFAVCGKHAYFSKDGIQVLSVNDAASAASAEILASLKSD